MKILSSVPRILLRSLPAGSRIHLTVITASVNVSLAHREEMLTNPIPYETYRGELTITSASGPEEITWTGDVWVVSDADCEIQYGVAPAEASRVTGDGSPSASGSSSGVPVGGSLNSGGGHGLSL